MINFKLERILKKKYNSNKETYQIFLIESLIRENKTHFYIKLQDYEIFNNEKEFLSKFYTKINSIEKIKSYSIYYKYYSLYFCKPIFLDFSIRNIMNKNIEIQAKKFFNENKEHKSKYNNSNNKFDYIFFNKEIVNEIENNFQEKKRLNGYNNYNNEKLNINNLSIIHFKKNIREKTLFFENDSFGSFIYFLSQNKDSNKINNDENNKIQKEEEIFSLNTFKTKFKFPFSKSKSINNPKKNYSNDSQNKIKNIQINYQIDSSLSLNYNKIKLMKSSSCKNKCLMEIGKKNILSSQLLKKNIEKFNKRYIECKNIIRNNKIKVDDSINNKINQNFIELPQIKNNLNIKTKKKFSSHKLLPKIFPYLKTKHKIFNK
jgi:hypothetical protein